MLQNVTGGRMAGVTSRDCPITGAGPSVCNRQQNSMICLHPKVVV